MADRFHMINEITPDTQRWKARVAVQKKLGTQDARSTGTRLQKLILVDAEGNTAAAIIFGKDIAAYQNTLVEGSTYVIKGAKLGITLGYENLLASCKFQWTLNKRTLIVPDNDNPLKVPALQYTINSQLFILSRAGLQLSLVRSRHFNWQKRLMFRSY